MASAQSPAPQATPGQQPILNDRQKWERSMARWDTSIVPQDPWFKRRLEKYQKDLTKQSVHNILMRDFSTYEVRKFESGYVEKKRFKAIHERQKIDATAYKAMLEAPPFNAEPDNVKASLAFKLTMMYFGFPVEPMRFTDPLNLSGPLGNLGFTSLFQDDDDEDSDDDLAFVPEELRPLRFLNSYDKRGFGKDNSHMNPEKTYELYYGIPMMVQSDELEKVVSLRGGGNDDSSSDDQPSVMGNDEDDEDSVMGDDVTDEEPSVFMGSGADSAAASQPGELVSLRGGSGRDATAVDPGQTEQSPPQESAEDRASRTTGPEVPAAIDDYEFEPRSNLTYSTDGFPTRGEILDDFAKGKLFREWSYSQPLSISMKGQHPAIPINAPPLEAIFKTPGHKGLPSDAVPVMSTQVMTPTEQRQLQEAFFRMRTFALNRAQPCPYEGCRAYFPVDPEGMVSFRKHLKASHVGTNCPFCTTTLFAYWNPSQIEDHFLTNHADYFSRKGDLRRDDGAKVQSLGLTHRREEQWNFCARCGRNHNLLITKADRINHNNRCYPGLVPESSETSFCRDCGQKEPPQSEGRHDCTATAEEKIEHVYCTGCALPAHHFSRVYAQKHLTHCKGVGGKRAGWCPWCGVDLRHLGPSRLFGHLDACGRKPPTGEGPIDTSTGAPRESPLDGPTVGAALYPYRVPGQIIIPVPDKCPFERCPASEAEWRPLDARWLTEHFRTAHSSETALGRVCPLCDLNFGSRQFNTSHQKEAHFDDHIHQHAFRIVADKLIADSSDWSDPTIQLLFRKRDGGGESTVPHEVVELERDRSTDQQTIRLLQEQIRQLEDARAKKPASRPSSTALGKRPVARKDDEGDDDRAPAQEGPAGGSRGPKRARTRTSRERDPTYRPPAQHSDSDDDYVRIEGSEELLDGSNYSDTSVEQGEPSAPAPEAPSSSSSFNNNNNTNKNKNKNKNNPPPGARLEGARTVPAPTAAPVLTTAARSKAEREAAAAAAAATAPILLADAALAGRASRVAAPARSSARSARARPGRGGAAGAGAGPNTRAAGRTKGRQATVESGGKEEEEEGEGEDEGEVRVPDV